jgi:hypothetical protein
MFSGKFWVIQLVVSAIVEWTSSYVLAEVGKQDGFHQKPTVFFESNSKPFSATRDEELKTQYVDRRSEYCGSPVLPHQQCDVEL